MSKSLILWISALIITFLIGYIQNRTSPEYPISGTFGIDGKKVSYHIKKVCSNKNDYQILIRTDIENLAGIVKWRKLAENQVWQIDSLVYSENILASKIPKQPALTEIEYNVILSYKEKEYFLPSNEASKLKFLGSVPLTIDIHFFLTLFVGLLLAFRVGLEFFNAKPRLRLYSIFTLISFFACALIFAPVKKAYEMGAIGRTVPPIFELFDGWLIALVLIWILNLIFISYMRNPRNWILISSTLTLIVFLSQNFFR